MTLYKKTLKTFSLELSANKEYPIGVQGNMYAVLKNTEPVTIKIDDSTLLDFQQAGMGGEFEGDYQRIIVKSDTSQNVILVFGYGKFYDSRSSVNASLSTKKETSSTLDTKK